MSPITEILDCIERVKSIHQKLTNNDVISILKATKRISDNEEFLDNLIFFYNNINQDQISKTINLSNREKEILHLIGLGLSNQCMASELSLSISTIETHRKNIRKKLNVSGNGKLLQYAILHNLHNVTTTII